MFTKYLNPFNPNSVISKHVINQEMVIEKSLFLN